MIRLSKTQDRDSPRGRLIAVDLVLASVGVALLLSEALLRILGIGYGTVHMASSPVLHHAHPRNYRFVSYHRSGEYGGHIVYFDEDGLRADPEATSESRAVSQTTVALMGDSFVEALQVSHEDSFPGRLQAAAPDDASILNYGTSSYSPLLYLLQWRHQIAVTSPTHVVLMLYGNDVRDDRDMTDLGKRDAEGKIVAVPGPEVGGFTLLMRQSYLARFLNKVRLQFAWAWEHRGEARDAPLTGFIEEHPDIVGLTDGYLCELVDEVRRSGAETILTAVPSKERTLARARRTGEPTFSDKVGAWSEANGVPFVDLELAFYAAADAAADVGTAGGGVDEPLFFVRDIHFTSAGHQLVAETLATAHPTIFTDRSR